MAWLYLFIAGGLEVFWSTFLKLSEGFTRLWPSVWAVVGMVASFFFLSQATKTLPMGTALRYLDGHRRPGRRHRGHSGLPGACHCPAAHFRGAAARRYRRTEAHRITAKKTAFAVFFMCLRFRQAPAEYRGTEPQHHRQRAACQQRQVLSDAPQRIHAAAPAGTRRRRYAW